MAKIDESIIDEFRKVILSKHTDVQKIIIEASYKHYILDTTYVEVVNKL